MPTVRKSARERVRNAARKQNVLRAKKRPAAPFVPNEKGYRWARIDGEQQKVKRDA